MFFLLVAFYSLCSIYHAIIAQAHVHLCAGYYKLMVAAKKEDKIMTPNPQFDNEQVRYEHRFAAFGGLITPPLMPYQQYKVIIEEIIER